jgi:cytochrome P450
MTDYLVRATDSTGQQLPKENLLPAVTVACGAGFTTTSSLLSWCIYGLVTYPGIQARLLQELIDNDINDTDNITAEQIDELPMLANFIKEMQRRHNPSYQPGRTAQQDLILPGGYQLKKGTVVICAIHHIHNNSKVWNNPDTFDPDRWNHDPLKGLPKATYAPFASGGRMCVGFNFALLEVKIFMCKLVYRYHWEKEGDVETNYDPFFQLIRPVDLYVKTTRRETYPTKSAKVEER